MSTLPAPLLRRSHSRLGVLALLLGAQVLWPTLAGADPAPVDENPIVELGPLAEEGLNVRFVSKTALRLHIDRGARRVLDVLPAKQVIQVLAMDRFGLQVRGRGKNGELTGWIGQKQAFADQPTQLASLRSFYNRQVQIEQFLRDGSPAIGMNLAELKRILGKPTTHTISATEGGTSESLIWIIKQPVDLNELLAVGSDEDILKMEVEVGRVEVEMAGGLAKAIHRNLDGGAAVIPTIAPPVPAPFGTAPEAELAGK